LYTVIPDPRQLPTDYRSTTQPIEVHVQTPDTPAAVTVGAALPARSREITFEAGSLSVFASSTDNALPVGADLQLEALTQGKVERVTAKLGNNEITLEIQDGVYKGTLRIPAGLELGGQTVLVTAFSATGQSTFEVPITIVDVPLFVASVYKAITDTEIEFNLSTLFKVANGNLELVFASGERIKLESDDGYNWRGVWKALKSPARVEAQLYANAQLLGTVVFVVVAPDTLLMLEPNLLIDFFAAIPRFSWRV
jgi:hypothetical protein